MHQISFGAGRTAIARSVVVSAHLSPPPRSGERQASAQGAHAPRIRVLVAEPHAATRRSLCRTLADEEGFEVLGAVDDPDALALEVELERHRPDVVVLGLELRESSSLEAIRAIRERSTQTKIVVSSSEEDPVLAQRALTAGAGAVVAASLASGELSEAVRAAASDRQFLSPRVAARLDALHRSLTGNRLTRREVEILRLIAFGHTSVEIARMLHLSPRTIETHRAHIHKKLALRTRAELVRYALRRGVIGA